MQKNDKVLGALRRRRAAGLRAVGSRTRGFAWVRAANPARYIYILYVQAVQKRNPAEPMNFMREKVGSRVPMTADYSDLLR